MPKARHQLPPITDEEEAAIQAGIAADPDNPEWTAEDFKKARPFKEVFPELYESWKRTRGAQKAPTKQLVSLRLDPDVIAHFKAQGAGWQTRINKALRKAMAASEAK
jgi:uncharacterized protein (DUF4415 family)